MSVQIAKKRESLQPVTFNLHGNNVRSLSSHSSSKSSLYLSSYYQNVRGLRSKYTSFHNAVLNNDYDIIILTETWLNDSFNDRELFSPDYNIYRCDRSTLTSKHKRGGGVLIAVKSRFVSCQHFIESSFSSLELLWVKLISHTSVIYICVVYIPPNSSVEYYNLCSLAIDSVTSLMTTSESCIIFGDFNLPKIEWVMDEHHLIPRKLVPNSEDGLIENLLLAGLTQRCDIPNHQGRFLDLMFSDIEDIVVTSSDNILVHLDLYHPAYNVNIPLNSNFARISDVPAQRLNFAGTDFVGLNKYFGSIQWDLILNDSCVERCVDTFYATVVEGLKQFVPLKLFRVNNHPPWFNKELINIKNRRDRASKKFARSGHAINGSKFSALRKKFKTLSASLYKQYIVRLQSSIKTKPNNFWRYIKWKRNSHKLPSLLSYNGQSTSDTPTICEFFAKFFSSNFGRKDINSEYIFPPSQPWLTLDENTVFKALSLCNSSTSPGPDGLPSIILAKCGDNLFIPLTILFNLSLQTSKFPRQWKSSYITPIFKNGDRSNVTNYRGIAMLSSIPKLFESLVYAALRDPISARLSVSQHGFMPKRATTTNLAVFSNYLYTNLVSNKQVDTIYTDFSKAFDRISHKILIERLSDFCLLPSIVCWICSYLIGRTQSVRFLNCISKEFNVLSGVPQGSHLGPLLFLIFIDSLPDVLQFSHCLMYADDVKIFRCINRIEDCFLLQSDLLQLSNWCTHNKLPLNIKKCNVVSYQKSRSTTVQMIDFQYVLDLVTIVRLEQISDLGVLFDKSLNFNGHIDRQCSKALSALGLIIRFSKEFNDPFTLKSLYEALVRPLIEFSSIIWNPIYKIRSDKIERIQKRFLRFALRKLQWIDPLVLPPYSSRLLLLGMSSLHNRRRVASAIFVYDILCNYIDAPELGALITTLPLVSGLRTRDLLATRLHRSIFSSKEPIDRACKHFNEVLRNLNCPLFNLCILRASFKRCAVATFQLLNV